MELSEVVEYLGETSYDDAEILDALTAETAAQARRVRALRDGETAADLGQALKRRVARNLAARAVPIAQYTSFEGGSTSARVPAIDAEIARLEAPWKRRVVG